MRKTILTLMVVILGIFLIGFQQASAEYPGWNECLGTGTPGYWKNHPGAWPGNITIGGVEYTPTQAIAIMNMPVKGDKSITMFKASVAALLNVEEQDCFPPYYYYQHWWRDCLEDADLWLQAFPVGSGVRANSEAWQYSHGELIYFCLDDYNNGEFPYAPSRDSLE